MLHQNQQNINDIIIYCTIKGEKYFSFFCDKMTNFMSKKIVCFLLFSHHIVVSRCDIIKLQNKCIFLFE